MTEIAPAQVSLAAVLDEASRLNRVVPRVLVTGGLAQAYRIQDEAAQLRRARGDNPIGYKIGLTSSTARAAWGARTPGRGVLFASTVRRSPAQIEDPPFPLQYEVELALIIDAPIERRHLAVETLPSRVRSCHAAVEVVGSRWQDGAPDLASWAADNAMAVAAVLSEAGCSPSSLPEPLVAQSRTHGVTTTASTSDAYASLQWLAKERLSAGVPLKAGDIVLTGAIIGPLPIGIGDQVEISLRGVGDVRVGVAAGLNRTV